MNAIEQEKKSETKSRIKYFDIARGLAMVSIIAGHLGHTAIIRFVFTFHVPLFFIISGIFFKRDIEKIKKNAVRLLKPYVFTVICIACLDLLKTALKTILSGDNMIFNKCLKAFSLDIVAGLYGSGSRTDFIGYTLPAIGAIWFLLALIWSQLFIYIIISNTGKHRGTALLTATTIVLVWLAGYYSAQITWLPLSIQPGLCAVIFIYAGIILKEKHWNVYIQEPNSNGARRIFLVSLLVWIVAILFSYYDENMSLVRCYFPAPAINIAGAIAATHVICTVANILEHTKVAKFLEYVGRNSLIILSFHLIELNTFPWDRLHLNILLNSYISILVLFILKMGWCLFGVWASHKISLLKKIFT